MRGLKERLGERLLEKAIVGACGLYITWMIWITTGFYALRQDVALIKELELGRSQVDMTQTEKQRTPPSKD